MNTYDILIKDMNFKNIEEISKDYNIITFSDINDEEDDLSDQDFLSIDKIENEDNIVITKYNLNNNIITFNIDNYLSRIFKSYNYNDKNIEKQFIIDFYRKQIFNNHKNINNHNEFMKSIAHYTFKIIIADHTLRLDHVILMLLTQASLALPFILLNKIYTDETRNLFIRFVVSEQHKLKASFTDSTGLINIKLEAPFSVIDIKKEKNMNLIYLTLHIDIIFKNNNYIFPELGIISWNLSNY